MDKKLNRYYREIEKHLPCSRAEKKKFLRSFQTDVESYLESNSGCTAESVFRQFGGPEKIAEEYVSSVDQSIVQKYLTERRKFWTFIKVVLVVLAAAIITLMTIFVADTWAFNHGQGYETPAIEGTASPDFDNGAIEVYGD